MRDRIKRIVGESGMGDRFLRRTFSTFQLTDDNKRAAAAARRYAEGFDANLMILPDISIQRALTEHGARIPNPAHYCGMRVIGHQAQTSGCPIAT